MAIDARKNYFLPEIGPLMSVPEFISDTLIDRWRTIGLSGDCLEVEGEDYVAINDNVKNVDWFGHPWTAADGSGVYHDICGYHLYRVNSQTGDKEYTGKDIIWQYHIDSVAIRDNTPVWYNIDFQIIIRTDAGVLVQQLGSNRYGLGYDGASTRMLQIGYTAIRKTHDGHSYIGFGLAANWNYQNEPTHRYYAFAIPAISENWLENNDYVTDIEITDDPNAGDPGGRSGEGGGDGDHSYNDDAIPLPSVPTLGAVGAQMITLYRMNDIEMASFAHDLWSDGWTQIKALFSDPMDFIVGCMVLPFEPTIDGSAKPKYGIFTWQNAYRMIKAQYQVVDCGTIDINKFYGSCFDYDPYRKISCYIPYIGYRDLPIDKIMGKTIGCKIYCDCLTGDCVAFIYITGDKVQVIGQYAGNVGVRVPMSRQSWDAAISAGISLLGGAVAMAAGGIAQGMGIEASELSASQIGNQASAATMSAVNAAKTSVKRSGTQGASAGYMSIQDPFIIDTIPRQSLPDNYKELEGYPSNIYGLVGSFQGFLAVEKIKLETTATETEKDMIMQLLKGGIYL